MLIPSARAGKDPAGYVKKQDTWFADQEAKRTAVNILSQPSEPGGWPKHIDTTVLPWGQTEFQFKLELGLTPNRRFKLELGLTPNRRSDPESPFPVRQRDGKGFGCGGTTGP